MLNPPASFLTALSSDQTAVRAYGHVLQALTATATNRALIRALTNKSFAHVWNDLRYKGMPIPCFRHLRLLRTSLPNLDLTGTDWYGASLDSASLANSDLRYSRLTNARFRASNLNDTNLSHTAASHMRLTGTSTYRLLLEGADTRRSPPLPTQAIPPALPTPKIQTAQEWLSTPQPSAPNGLILTGARPKAWLSVFSNYVSARYSYVVIPEKGYYQNMLAQLHAQATQLSPETHQLDMHQIHLFSDWEDPLPYIRRDTPLSTLQCMYVPLNEHNRETRKDAGKARTP